MREGRTDARGLVCFTGIRGGDAKIEWPDVSAKYVGSDDDAI